MLDPIKGFKQTPDVLKNFTCLILWVQNLFVLLYKFVTILGIISRVIYEIDPWIH